MDLTEALRTRRAIREYTDEGLSDAEIARLIDIAVLAPSAMNLQPWVFAVVRGAPRLHELSRRIKPYVLEHLPPDSPLAGHVQNADFEIFHGAPALIVVCSHNTDSQSNEDCCLAAQNVMLAAHDRGLGSCWIGLARGWLNEPAVKDELGIAAHLHPIAPIIVGHRRQLPAPTPRVQPQIIWCK
ncbi:MAG TPA: nitroreductase [Spongiibacteraceae bacterium]|nr:nitroreductase [Spongiibacteraceae bacterium]